jgi:beta-galactosidase
MEKVSFNEQWTCYPKGKSEQEVAVDVPHDAMLLDRRTDTSPSGINAGWYDVQDYVYSKTFFVPDSYREKEVIFEFEGVYQKATVFINDRQIAYHDYGYTGFFVKAKNALKYGEENTIRVEVINSDQPNCRWYSGTGIYRPVWLYLLPEKHISLQGIKINTMDYRQPRIRVEALIKGKGTVKVEILDRDTVLHMEEGKADGQFAGDISLPQAQLWSPETPYLYTCKVSYGEDVQEETFGIRMVEASGENGFCINGKRIILKGACVHHDNGILGACAYDYAEARKIRILKENGYNAIRSAHNPCSKAMLKACDEQGMLVMDEYTDVWYIHKTKYDYASRVENNYRDDLKWMVDKDYNHPSVIMYSTGNEVSETAQKKGIQLTEKMTRYLHELDPGRPVTCGINIFFNFLSSMGFGVYSDKKAEKAAEVKKKTSVGSEFYNNLAGLLGSDFMKWGATLYPCDVKTRDAFARMDIAGYNYGIRRYRKDLRNYPERLILGTETFCSDAYAFWEIAKENKKIIGDFVWAGMDYLGEVGIGAREYRDYAPDFSHGKGWVSAGSGRIDLTGKPLAEMAYTQVAFEQRKIGIGVIPVYQGKGPHSPSAWKMTNAIESWSWHGCDGRKAKVEVYARAHHISLYVNGECVGTKKPGGNCLVTFHTAYRDGEVRAVSYNEKNDKIAEAVLKTAEKETILAVEPEQDMIKRETDLCYVRFRFTDKDGILKPMVREKLKISVEGGKLLAFGSACPFYPDSYLTDVSDTYYGEALAVIKPGIGDKVVIKASGKTITGMAEVEVQ